MIPIAIGLLILCVLSLLFVGISRKNERLIKWGMASALFLIALLFLYCHSKYQLSKSTAEKHREMTGLSLFFAILLATVLRNVP
ncbi:MAG: hypothetical protein FWF59_08740 [Turicibacter sp.]|nr:hypothetical protein [Turicibacter sp.]